MNDPHASAFCYRKTGSDYQTRHVQRRNGNFVDSAASIDIAEFGRRSARSTPLAVTPAVGRRA
jgi:hypothetical protein